MYKSCNIPAFSSLDPSTARAGEGRPMARMAAALLVEPRRAVRPLGAPGGVDRQPKCVSDCGQHNRRGAGGASDACWRPSRPASRIGAAASAMAV